MKELHSSRPSHCWLSCSFGYQSSIQVAHLFFMLVFFNKHFLPTFRQVVHAQPFGVSISVSGIGGETHGCAAFFTIR
jgi:hypothetical protein